MGIALRRFVIGNPTIVLQRADTTYRLCDGDGNRQLSKRPYHSDVISLSILSQINIEKVLIQQCKANKNSPRLRRVYCLMISPQTMQ